MAFPFPMRQRVAVLAALAVLGFAVVYLAILACYFATDASYQRLVAQRAHTKSEVEAVLRDIRPEVISDHAAMNPGLAKVLTEGASYLRYDRYHNGGIDVVVDRNGTVKAIWPNYE